MDNKSPQIHNNLVQRADLLSLSPELDLRGLIDNNISILRGYNQESESNTSMGTGITIMGPKQIQYNPELDLLETSGQEVPTELGTQHKFPLGARPKLVAVPRDLMDTTGTEEQFYKDSGDDPRPAQQAILQQCVLNNSGQSNRDAAEVVRVSKPTNQRLCNEITPTESYAMNDPSQEQKEVIRTLAESNRSQSIRELQIKNTVDNIAKSLHSMNLREIRHFQQDLTEQRRSQRLQGTDPEVIKTTGSRVEDSRILLDKNIIVYKK